MGRAVNASQYILIRRYNPKRIRAEMLCGWVIWAVKASMEGAGSWIPQPAVLSSQGVVGLTGRNDSQKR